MTDFTTLTNPCSGVAFSAGITGVGGYLPEGVVTNQMLASRLDTDHDWITSRTGILERRIADESQSTSDLAVEAGSRALRSAANPEVQALVLATTTPDFRCPATAPYVAARMGLGKIPAFDVSAVCSGFLYATSVAVAYVNSGHFDSVLVIAAEKFSTLIDPNDRNTACLFGDGAGSVVISKVPVGTGGQILAHAIHSDGELESLIKVKGGGSRYPLSPHETVNRPRSDYFLGMQGREVFAAATASMSASVSDIISTAGWELDDLDWLIAHQANRRILNLVCKSLDIPPEKACVHLDEVGNTAGASIPLLLAAKSRQFKPGDKLVLTSFGAGATWGALAMTWPALGTIEAP
ncbi:ketoacyl-ACP synthase III [Paraburkholderia xenovorans]|uniref:beta-ketoacyl-ACP synthase III n=1 Tax=Paraburkholderia xenovorans TaxID=36873 RepID=UPI0038B6FBF8